MIYLSFSFTNPFSNRFSAVYEKTGKTWNPHKFWDLSICKTSSIIGFTFDYTMRQDHAGFGFDIGIFGWNIDYRFYDSRHWDYTNNCWEEIND
jgi:hypothetical protein